MDEQTNNTTNAKHAINTTIFDDISINYNYSSLKYLLMGKKSKGMKLGSQMQ